jgi:signal transduction histidine kinase
MRRILSQILSISKENGMKGILLTLILLLAVCSPLFAIDAPDTPEAKHIVDLVNNAAAMLEQKGTDAFTAFRAKESVWYKGETYIFVYDLDGTVLCNPPYAGYEGKNLMDLKDQNGKAFVRELIETAKSKGSGWVDYLLPKPGEMTPSKKIGYVRTAKMPDGKSVLVGSGIYVK